MMHRFSETKRLRDEETARPHDRKTARPCDMYCRRLHYTARLLKQDRNYRNEQLTRQGSRLRDRKTARPQDHDKEP
jgi:hypothetical protein